MYPMVSPLPERATDDDLVRALRDPDASDAAKAELLARGWHLSVLERYMYGAPDTAGDAVTS